MNTRTITLTITEKCNLACTYCYEHNKSAANMTFDTAKAIIDKELRYSNQAENTYVEFFGGEPFLNFELIKQVVEYILSFYRGKLRFFATTNGTLVHGDIQEWLKKNSRFVTVGLSLDGTRRAHNMNRSSSFDDIDLDFFLNEYPNQSVKMTVSEQTLPFLAESIAFLHEYGFEVECNLAYMVDWTSPNNLPILAAQLNCLIDYYLEHPDTPKCRLMNFSIDYLARPFEDVKILKKYCGTGTAMHCYDIAGQVYPCQLFAPISAGDRAKKLGELPIHDEFSVELLDEKCRNCYYLRICPICMGSNYLSTGNLYRSDEARCELYKIIFQANAKLKALEWERGLLKLDDEGEQALLRSILHIQTINK